MPSFLEGKIGWGGRIRTFTVLINSEVSYQLDHAPAAHRQPGSAARRWGVVQLVGHLTVNEDGEGSNPSAPANLSSRRKRCHDMAAGRCDRRSAAGAARSLAFRTSRKTLPSPDSPIRQRNQ